MGKLSGPALTLFILVLLMGIPTEQAAWIEDGSPICTGTYGYNPAIISDGAGGAIIAWRDSRNLHNDIYAQRVNSRGAPYWLDGGIGICTELQGQDYPQLVPDGAGGAIIVWVDTRSYNTSDRDIYAQRVDANGGLVWQAEGVAICNAAGRQEGQRIIPDGNGGAIITWYDNRSGNYDIYAQRINADSLVQWTTNGVAICTATGDQGMVGLELVSDGAGGAIIAWADQRTDFDIYAARVDANGDIEWTPGGVAVCVYTNTQYSCKLAADGTGGAIIAWDDYRSGTRNIYAQRINSSGTIRWAANGIAICTSTGNQYISRLIRDGTGGAIMLWTDARGADNDLYAQKVDSLGAAQWQSNGAAVCTATEMQTNPSMVPDGEGGAVVVWRDERNGNSDIYAQRFDADCNILWAPDGVAVCTALEDQRGPLMTTDGAGGAIITWYDYRSGYTEIYAHRVGADGEPTATLLQSHRASLVDSYIEISWILSEAGNDMVFTILRAEGDSGTFLQLADPQIRVEGLTYRFLDTGCEPGRTYLYRVGVLDEEGRKALFETGPITTPGISLTLFQNHPNPFNPATTIRYYLPRPRRVALEVFDITGRSVIRLVDEDQENGIYTVEWNGLDINGRSLGSGIYLYRLKAGKEIISNKMVLLR